MDIIVDSSIRLNSSDLPKNVLEEIYNKLRVPNPRKITAEREMLWGAKNLPDYIEIWDMDVNGSLVLPRGFLKELDKILIDNDIGSNFIDKTFIGKERLFKNIDQIDLRDYQWKAFHELNIQSQGIYKAPTASGKTRTMLEVIRQAGQKTLVICEKKDIAIQWIKTAEELGIKNVGYIGNSSWQSDRDLVIGLRQSLWLSSQTEAIKQDWFDQWGMVVVDECHHCTADTMIDLVQRFPAYYRFGCSATPDADPDLFPIAQAVIGPVVAESTPEEIGDHLVIPSVRVVKTEFEFPYRPTVRSKSGSVERNNYNDMMEYLETDENRNKLIADLAYMESNRNHFCLVVSKRKNHLNEIMDFMPTYGEDEVIRYFRLTGDNSKEYSKLLKLINKSNKFVIFSTIADEGTNIPCLDRLFLAYPGRKLRGFEQTIGRIMRPHPQKKDAIVYDFRDANVSVLNSQFRNRCQNIYHKKNYKVETL